jgi:NADPH-dependent glutamate synthase beta subunit-like oxidoreductase
MRAQLNFFASRIDAKQEEMKDMLDACLEKMEENPGAQKSVAVLGQGPKGEAAAKSLRWH